MSGKSKLFGLKQAHSPDNLDKIFPVIELRFVSLICCTFMLVMVYYLIFLFYKNIFRDALFKQWLAKVGLY